jgi:hypothetical protein
MVVGAGAQFMREPGDEEHQFGGFVARIVRAMTEMDARSAQRARAMLDGGANAARTDGFDSCVG